jgi:hypothetical protein
MWKWLTTFIIELGKMISGPPYLAYLFISPILVIVSMLTNSFFEYTWTLLVFSLTGAMWRHIEKDVDSQLTKWLIEKYLVTQKPNIEMLKLRVKLIIVVIYQAVNILLLAGLIIYLLALRG